jgi:coenzyme F420 hydrogenase subunit delta
MTKSIYQKERLIFGCGNPRFGGAGFGSEVIQWLETIYVLPKDTECLDVGPAIREFLFDILPFKKKPSQIIIIDAMNLAHAKPGEIREIEISDIRPSKHNIHPLRHFQTIKILNIIRKYAAIDIRILVTQPIEISSQVNSGQTFSIKSSVSQMCERIIHILEKKPTMLSHFKDHGSEKRFDQVVEN